MKNKKNLIIVLLIVIIAIIISILLLLLNISTNKIKKGDKLFGNEFCEGHAYETGLTVMTEYVCSICGAKKEAGIAPPPVICKECSKLTGRCERCGKKELSYVGSDRAPNYYIYELIDAKLKNNTLIIEFSLDDKIPYDIDNKFFDTMLGDIIINDVNYSKYKSPHYFDTLYDYENFEENLKLDYQSKSINVVKQNNKFYITLTIFFDKQADIYLNDLFKSTYYKLGEIITKETTTCDKNGNYMAIDLKLPLILEIDLWHYEGNKIIGVKNNESSNISGIIITPEQLGISMPTTTK